MTDVYIKLTQWHLGMNDLTWGDQEHGPLGHGFQYYYGLPWTLVDEFVSEVRSEKGRKDNLSSECRNFRTGSLQ